MFKQRPELIIVEVIFELTESKDDIQKRLDEIKDEFEKRLAKQPIECPSAGCTFKNIVYKPEYTKLEAWQIHGKVPSAKLILVSYFRQSPW